MVSGANDPTSSETAIIMFSGIIGATVCLFRLHVVFSSRIGGLCPRNLLFVIIFWSIVKWESHAEDPNSDRWILFMALMMGLSIGVHLLALLVIPAICLIYYFKNYKYSPKGFWSTILIGVGLVAFILYGLLDKLIGLGAAFDRLFVNGFNLGYGSGLIFYSVIIIGAIVWTIRYSIKKENVFYTLQ